MKTLNSAMISRLMATPMQVSQERNHLLSLIIQMTNSKFDEDDEIHRIAFQILGMMRAHAPPITINSFTPFSYLQCSASMYACAHLPYMCIVRSNICNRHS
jgi:hypothetical protein